MRHGGQGRCQLEFPKGGTRELVLQEEQIGQAKGRAGKVSRVGAGSTGREAGPRALRGMRLWQWLRGWGTRSPKSGVYSRD